MIDLFDPVVPTGRRHRQFEDLRQSDDHKLARKSINMTFNEMGDPNGRFVRDFQGRGFHSRLFELACFAYLRSAGLNITGRFERPDFIVGTGAAEIAIEATSANPPDAASQDISVINMTELTEAELEEQADVVFTKRVIASLKKKLEHRYHELPHVNGKPLVLMVAPYFEPGSVFYVDESLVDALYPTEPHPSNIPFFCLPESASISAVAYCNTFTVPKFWRLADHDFLANSCIAERTGMALFEGDTQLKHFRYRIGHEATPVETWSEGVTLFFNPVAEIPLPVDALPASSKFLCEGDMVHRRVKGFHPLASFMQVWPRTEQKPAQLDS